MGRKTGYCEHNRNKLDIEVAHCRWGKIRMRGNGCSAPQMSWSAAIHGAFGFIGRRGEGRFRLGSGHAVVMMLVHGAITMVYCHGVARNRLACSRAGRRHRREHGRKQSKNYRDG